MKHSSVSYTLTRVSFNNWELYVYHLSTPNDGVRFEGSYFKCRKILKSFLETWENPISI